MSDTNIIIHQVLLLLSLAAGLMFVMTIIVLMFRTYLDIAIGKSEASNGVKALLVLFILAMIVLAAINLSYMTVIIKDLMRTC